MKLLPRRLRELGSLPRRGGRLVELAPPVAARELMRRYRRYLRPYRGRIAAGLVVAALIPLLETVEIWLFGVVVDDVLVARDLHPLAWIAGVYVAMAVGSGVLSYADDMLATWVGERFVLDVRRDLFAHLLRLAPGTLDRRRAGDTLARVTGDVQAIESFVLAGVADGLSALLRLAFFGAALFVLSWKLALVAVVVVPLFWGTARACATLVRRTAREKRRRSGALAAIAEEALGNLALVQTLNRERAERERFETENEAMLRAELAGTHVRGLYGPVVDLIELLGILLVIAAGVWVLSAGELTVGGLLAFLAYLGRMYGPVRELGSLAPTLFAAAAGAERVSELLDLEPAVQDRAGARPLPAATVAGHVELSHVSFRHPGATRDALHDVSLEVRPGEFVAVSGPSGAGKSTLASLLVRFADPGTGAVRLDGHDLRDLRLADVREAVGLLLQESLAADTTVREAIAAGRPDAGRTDVVAAADAAGVLDWAAGMPEGLDTRIGRSGRALSGGQLRRLAVARALVRDSPVLVLDEPTTGLDAATRDRLLEPLRILAAGRTVILISHDPVVEALADRVVHLRDGRVVADAVPALAA